MEELLPFGCYSVETSPQKLSLRSQGKELGDVAMEL